MGNGKKIAAALITLLVWSGASRVCAAQGGAQSSAAPSASISPHKHGGVLEIAPQVPGSAPGPESPSATEPDDQNTGDQNTAGQNADNQGAEDDVVRYRTYGSSARAVARAGQLPYLGISVHSTTLMQLDGGQQQRALEVLSVDSGSPAAEAGIKGSGSPTKLGASTLTASALLGPAQLLMAPLLKKTGQLGKQGDLIVAADDNRVGTEEDLAAELGRLKPGDTLWLTVLREPPSGQPKAVRIPIKLAAPRAAAESSSAAK